MISKTYIKNKIEELGLREKNICIHCSFKSFGATELKTDDIIKAFLESDCTLLTPTFSYGYLLNPDEDNRPENNDWDYSIIDEELELNKKKVFSTSSREIDSNMGILSKSILNFKNSRRGYHPLDSFTALGRNSEELVSGQRPQDIFSPFRELVKSDGYIVLMGVNYNRMTFIHHCEKLAGRNLFIRWANSIEGIKIPVEIGGCSEGFNNFSKYLDEIAKVIKVGSSLWKILPAKKVETIIRDLIIDKPSITACENPVCSSCLAAVSGGPIL